MSRERVYLILGVKIKTKLPLPSFSDQNKIMHIRKMKRQRKSLTSSKDDNEDVWSDGDSSDFGTFPEQSASFGQWSAGDRTPMNSVSDEYSCNELKEESCPGVIIRRSASDALTWGSVESRESLFSSWFDRDDVDVSPSELLCWREGPENEGSVCQTPRTSPHKSVNIVGCETTQGTWDGNPRMTKANGRSRINRTI